MIARTFILLAAAVSSTTAFTVQPTSRLSTQLYNVGDRQNVRGADPETEAKLRTDPQIKDAKRVVINECDDMECAVLSCEQDARGNWTCEGGLDNHEGSTKTVLMSVQDDDE